MKNIWTLLIASTVLSTALGLPALSAVRSPAGLANPVFVAGQDAASIILVGEDDNDGDRDSRSTGRSEKSNDDDDDCKSKLSGGCVKANNPAPAGSVAPPKNGLFGSGAAPEVQVK
tara:strand:- start:819 stop:1166 length:348 start_codon:yes stop_codon:yes gene_type:complete